MEAQIDTGASRGTGFDVPAQGLHMRDPEGTGTRRGVLDTTAGAVPVHMPKGDADAEVVVGVPEQFVELTASGDGYAGTLSTDAGDLRVRDVNGDITIGG